MVANLDTDITQQQWVVVAGFAVLAQVQKIKHGYPNHITEAFTVWGIHLLVSVSIVGKGEGHGFDALWSRVFIKVGFEEVGEAGIHGAICSESGIRGPQFGEHLHDMKDFIMNMRMSDRPATTGKGTHVESLGKTSKDFDFVVDAMEERVSDSEVGKERDPALNPHGVSCMGSVCGDTGGCASGTIEAMQLPRANTLWDHQDCWSLVSPCHSWGIVTPSDNCPFSDVIWGKNTFMKDGGHQFQV